MIRRNAMKLLGAIGLGGLFGAKAAGAIEEVDFEITAGEGGPVIGHAYGKYAVDARVFGTLVGNRLSITVMDGGRLEINSYVSIENLTIHEGGEANWIIPKDRYIAPEILTVRELEATPKK